MISFGRSARASASSSLVVEQPVLAAHAVLHRAEPFARQVGRGAVGQVAAGGQAHAEDGVARLQQRQEHRLVGLRAGVRLHVGEAAVEQLLGAVDGQLLGHVDVLAAAVVAPAGIALGVFVGQHRALRLQHRARRRCSPRRSARCRPAGGASSRADGGGQLGIGFGQRGGEEAAAGWWRATARSCAGLSRAHRSGRANLATRRGVAPALEAGGEECVQAV